MLQYSNFQRLWQSWAIRKLFPTDRKNYFYKAKGEKNQKGVYFEPYFPLSVGARSPAGWWPPSSPWWSHHSSSSSWWPGSRGAPWPSSACSLLPCTYWFSPVSPHSSSYSQGWAPRSFAFRTFRSFAFKKENVTFFSVLFSSFWRLMKPKRTLRSF